MGLKSYAPSRSKSFAPVDRTNSNSSSQGARQDFSEGAGMAFAGFCILLSLFWNLHTIESSVRIRPAPLEQMAVLLGLDQRWNMFSKPIIADGWFVLPGRLQDGRPVSLRQFQPEWWGPRWDTTLTPEWDKPASVLESVPRDRWRKLMMNMYAGHWGNTLKSNYSGYICRTWNHNRPNSDQLDAFHIYFVREDRLPSFENAEPRKVPLWKHECFSGSLADWDKDLGEFAQSPSAPPSFEPLQSP